MELKSDPATRHAVVILMTAARCVDIDGCDANAFIQQPFDVFALASTIERYLQ